LLALTGMSVDEVTYIGDDVNDLPVLEVVGLSACPADAAPEVRLAVHLVCEKPGGRGAVRELCELILKSRGAWPA
jgi:3-deoxy-D-manno-octulosonate 8-phosphate phosphatase (KDO 8-P phosphatase)